jgi:citrate lyase subunit beta/citryl-CoA lyase
VRRRSVLVLPGDSGRMVAKAQAAPADEVLMDLLELVPRLGPKLSSVVVPKVQEPSEVTFVDRLLAVLEPEGHRVEIQVQIEDPRGLEAVGQLAAASPRLSALIFGPGDFAAAMGMPTLAIGRDVPAYPGDIWHYPLYRIAVAARARGLQVVDGPYSALDDPEGLARSCERAVALGVDGKWAIHPAQLETINRAFTPSSEEVEGARAVLAQLGPGGARRMGGEMVDEASRRMAESLLTRAGESW